MCRHLNMVILNGRTLGDLAGNCTSHQYNGSAVVDYFIVARQLDEHVLYLMVHDVCDLSDHTALTVSLNFNCSANVENYSTSHNYSRFPKSFKWDEKSYAEALKLKRFVDRINVIRMESYTVDEKGMKNLCDDVTSVIIDAAKVSLHKRKLPSKTGSKPARWYNSNLYALKKDVLKTGKLLSKFPKDPFVRGNFMSKKKLYKKACRDTKRDHFNALALELDKTEGKSPQDFWRLLNSLKRTSTNSLELPSLEDFVKLFKGTSESADSGISDWLEQC